MRVWILVAQVQRSISIFKGETPKQKDRSDTQFTPVQSARNRACSGPSVVHAFPDIARMLYALQGSLAAAKRAAGAVVAAVDAVLGGNYRNAFCCVRPPGHHAGTVKSCMTELHLQF